MHAFDIGHVIAGIGTRPLEEIDRTKKNGSIPQKRMAVMRLTVQQQTRGTATDKRQRNLLISTAVSGTLLSKWTGGPNHWLFASGGLVSFVNKVMKIDPKSDAN